MKKQNRRKHSIENDKDEILHDFTSGKFESVNNLEEEIQIAKQAAKNTIKRDSRINIRISGTDLEKIRLMAEEEGLPYQTLVASIIHKFVTGRLTDKSRST